MALMKPVGCVKVSVNDEKEYTRNVTVNKIKGIKYIFLSKPMKH